MAATETLTHPVVGVRAFFLYPRRGDWLLENTYPAQGEDPGLYSMTCHTRWYPGVNTARCCPPMDIPRLRLTTCNDPPSLVCNCGLYAYHSLEIAAHNYNNYFLGCFAVVRGWGKTICHPDGWRAQFAEVLALIGDQPSISRGAVQFWRPPAIKYLAKTFEIPIVPYGAFPAMLTEFGQPVPVALRPKPDDYLDIE